MSRQSLVLGQSRDARPETAEGQGPAFRPGRHTYVPTRVPLRVVQPSAGVDLDAATEAAAAFLVALGVDVESESMSATPARMARAYAEMFSPRPFDLTTFPNDAGYDELIIARSIPLHSVCEHHLLPFVGVAHVGYLPVSESSACPSWPGWSNCSPAAPRCRSG